jgi:16S rRNA (guanine966-N2)-methyltransferase
VLRIVSGSARGRRLAAPTGGGTRPTADRVREALFSTLHSLLGPLTGARFADLYAGSGAVGLEALSRGAAHALLVESDPGALRVLRANVQALALPGGEVVRAKVERVVEAPPPGPAYDAVFLDPPYATPVSTVHRVLDALVTQGWLGAGAMVVVERPTRGPALAWPQGLAAERDRRYGEGTLWYGRARSE